MQNISFLDDRPVELTERTAAKAYKKGGLQAQKHAIISLYVDSENAYQRQL